MIGHATMMNKQIYSRNYHIFNRFDIPRCHCGSCCGMLMFSADSSSIIMFANIFMSYSIVQPETLNRAAQHHCRADRLTRGDHAHSTPQSQCKQSNVSTPSHSAKKQGTDKQLNNTDSKELPILENDTKDVIEYVKQTNEKKKKKFNFWKLLEND